MGVRWESGRKARIGGARWSCRCWSNRGRPKVWRRSGSRRGRLRNVMREARKPDPLPRQPALPISVHWPGGVVSTQVGGDSGRGAAWWRGGSRPRCVLCSRGRKTWRGWSHRERSAAPRRRRRRRVVRRCSSMRMPGRSARRPHTTEQSFEHRDSFVPPLLIVLHLKYPLDTMEAWGAIECNFFV
jgi:hypothetical protein